MPIDRTADRGAADQVKLVDWLRGRSYLTSTPQLVVRAVKDELRLPAAEIWLAGRGSGPEHPYAEPVFAQSVL